MGKKKSTPDHEEREFEEIDRDMDTVAGSMDEDGDPGDPRDPDDTEEDDDGEAESPEAPTSEEEALAGRVLASLRASPKALTVTALHVEIGEGGPNGGQDGYVAGGQVEKAVLLLVERGLATREGEAFVAAAPGTLAARRAALLQTFVELATADEEWADADRGVSRDIDKDPTKLADAAALVAAGLLAPPGTEGDDFYTAPQDKAKEAVFRGAMVLVRETMAECREAGDGAVITDGDVSKELAKERTSREGLEALYEGAARQRDDANRAAAKARGDLETLREWFTKNGLAWPLDKPEVPKPPREEFTESVLVDPVVRGRMYGIRIKLQRRQAEVDATFATAKATHKAHAEMIAGRIKTLDDAAEGMWYDCPAFRRVDLQRGVAEVVCVEDETWIVREVALRSEQIAEEKEKAKAEAPPPAPEAAPVVSDGTPAIVPASEHAKLTGEPVAIETTAAPVAAAEPAKEKRNIVLQVGPVGDALVDLVASFRPDEAITTFEATNRLAALYQIENVDALGLMVKAAAKKAHAAGRIRWELVDGNEMIGRVREKATETPAPAPAGADPADQALVMIREAGAAGIKPSAVYERFSDPTIDVVETLLERGAVFRNGKRGPGSRVIAAEHRAPAEVSP